MASPSVEGGKAEPEGNNSVLAKINEDDDDGEVFFGDVVLIGCVDEESQIASLLTGDGLFTNTMKASIPSNCLESTFRITQALQYDAKHEYERLSREKKKSSGLSSKLESARKQMKDEQEKNKQKLGKFDSNEIIEMVHYGDLIQLQHVLTGKFLSARSDFKFHLNDGSMHSVFRLESRYDFRDVADHVMYADRIIFQSLVFDGQTVAVRHETSAHNQLGHHYEKMDSFASEGNEGDVVQQQGSKPAGQVANTDTKPPIERQMSKGKQLYKRNVHDLAEKARTVGKVSLLSRSKSMKGVEDEIDYDYLAKLEKAAAEKQKGKTKEGEIVLRECPSFAALRGVGEVKLQSESLAFAFKMHKYSRFQFRSDHKRSTLSYLRTDQLVRFFHCEQKKSLTAPMEPANGAIKGSDGGSGKTEKDEARPATSETTHMCRLEDSGDGSGKIENDEARPMTMWELQSSTVSGALVEWAGYYHIVHSLTRKYLSLGELIDPDPESLDKRYNVVLVDEPHDDRCNFQLVSAENLALPGEARGGIDMTYVEIEGCTFRLAVSAHVDEGSTAETGGGDGGKDRNEPKTFWLQGDLTKGELCFRDKMATEDVYHLSRVDPANSGFLSVIRGVFPIAMNYCALFEFDDNLFGARQRRVVTTQALALLKNEKELEAALAMVKEIIRFCLPPPSNKEIDDSKLLKVDSTPNREFQDRARDGKVMDALMAMAMAPLLSSNPIFNGPELKWLEDDAYSKLKNVQAHIFKALTMLIYDNRESEMYFSKHKYACAAAESRLHGTGHEDSLRWPWRVPGDDPGADESGLVNVDESKTTESWARPRPKKGKVVYSQDGWHKGARARVVKRHFETKKADERHGQEVEVTAIRTVYRNSKFPKQKEIGVKFVLPGSDSPGKSEKMDKKLESLDSSVWFYPEDLQRLFQGADLAVKDEREVNVVLWINCVIHFCSSITFAQDLLGTLLNNNEDLLDKFVNEETVRRFEKNIATRGPEATTMKFFRQICSCNGKSIMSNQELCLTRLLETKESREQLLPSTCTLDTVAFDWVKSRMKDEATLEEKYKHVLDHTIDYEAYIEAKTDLDKATRDYNDNPNSDTVRISLSYAESDWKQQKGSGPKIEENGKRAEDFILKEFRRYFDHKEGKFLNALFSKLDKSGDLTLSTEELSDLVKHHEDLKGASIEEDGILLAFHDVLFFLKRFDRDHDGELDFDEFKYACQAHLYPDMFERFRRTVRYAVYHDEKPLYEWSYDEPEEKTFLGDVHFKKRHREAPEPFNPCFVSWTYPKTGRKWMAGNDELYYAPAYLGLIDRDGIAYGDYVPIEKLCWILAPQQLFLKTMLPQVAERVEEALEGKKTLSDKVVQKIQSDVLHELREKVISGNKGRLRKGDRVVVKQEKEESWGLEKGDVCRIKSEEEGTLFIKGEGPRTVTFMIVISETNASEGRIPEEDLERALPWWL
jgi:hypothetical protein